MGDVILEQYAGDGKFRICIFVWRTSEFAYLFGVERVTYSAGMKNEHGTEK